MCVFQCHLSLSVRTMLSWASTAHCWSLWPSLPMWTTAFWRSFSSSRLYSDPPTAAHCTCNSHCYFSTPNWYLPVDINLCLSLAQSLANQGMYVIITFSQNLLMRPSSTSDLCGFRIHYYNFFQYLSSMIYEVLLQTSLHSELLFMARSQRPFPFSPSRRTGLAPGHGARPFHPSPD